MYWELYFPIMPIADHANIIVHDIITIYNFFIDYISYITNFMVSNNKKLLMNVFLTTNIEKTLVRNIFLLYNTLIKILYQYLPY